MVPSAFMALALVEMVGVIEGLIMHIQSAVLLCQCVILGFYLTSKICFDDGRLARGHLKAGNFDNN